MDSNRKWKLLFERVKKRQKSDIKCVLKLLEGLNEFKKASFFWDRFIRAFSIRCINGVIIIPFHR